MFLVLSKTFDWILSPLSWAIVLIALGLVVRGRPRWAAGFSLAALGILVVFSSGAVANALVGWTERGARSTLRPGVTYDAVIVLGGGVDPDATRESGQPEYNAAPERILRGFEVLRAGGARNVILSAGTLDPSPDAVPEAVILQNQLELWGIEAARIIPESASRNTRENALETAKIVQARGFKTLLLITSAAHMPRALGCFHAVGLHPDVMPVDFRHIPKANGIAPRGPCLAASIEALHELAGRIVYRVAGYSAP